MSAPIERHSQEVWRKTAEQLNGDGFSVGGDDSPGKDVNKNGAPLLGDSRDLFRPKTSDIPAQPGVYKWRDGEGRVIYVGKAKNLRNPALKPWYLRPATWNGRSLVPNLSH